jgi:DHA1 family bicyclomycin/chloramphenicol resistance-like MFS transporter
MSAPVVPAEQTGETPNPHPGMGFAQFVVLMAAVMALSAFGIDSMLPALPSIAHSFKIARANDQQLVITVFLLSFGVAQLAYGPLVDRYGRKPVLLWGLALYAAFSLMSALATSFSMLLLSRCLQGVAVSSTRVAPISIVRDCYSGRRMAQVMSLSFLVFMVVPILAPTLGQAVILVASWRWIFAVLATAAFAVAVWTAIKLPETLKPEDRREINFTDTVDSFRIALKSGVGIGYTLATTMIFGALFGFINSAPQVFDQALHRPERFTVTFATIAGFIALSSLVNARLVPRLGMRVMSHAALVGFIAVSVVHAGVALSGHETLLVFAVLQSATMFSFGLMSGNFGALAMEPLGHVAGAAASAQGFISMVGGSVIGFVIGQQFDGTVVPITLGYAACGLIALAVVLVVEKGRLFSGHGAPPGTTPPIAGGH